MNRTDRNKYPLKIAIICGTTAALVLLSTAFLFDGTVKQLLLIIGLITSLAFGMLMYLVLRRVDPDFQSDTLELLFQLSKDEKVDQAQKNISKALYAASRRKDAVFQTLLDTRLANLTDDINQLGKGRIEFANTESWRVFYEQLLRSPSTTMYRSVAHIETPHYWQDGAGEKSTALNLEIHDSGKVSIERVAIIADHLWPRDEPFPVKPIRRWIDQQHRYGIWIELVRESELVGEPHLIADFGIYGFRAVGRQVSDSSGRTTRFTLSFEYSDVKEAEANWKRLQVFTKPFAEILDQVG
jgi:hypothetical protein